MFKFNQVVFTVNSENRRRKIKYQNGDKSNFIIGSIGANSYMNGMVLNLAKGDETVNFQVGNYCSLAYNLFLLINRDHDYRCITTSDLPLFGERRGPIKQKGQVLIGNDVWIGNNVIVLSGTRIGDGAVVGAGAVVSKDVPPYSIGVGNPIRIIKRRYSDEQIEKLLKIQWWNWDEAKIAGLKDHFSEDVDNFINVFYEEPCEPESLSFERKTTSLLFIPDFDDPYPVWQKVLTEYMDRFTEEDDVSLILRIENDENFEEYSNKVRDLVTKKSDIGDILIFNDEIRDERSLFKEMDFFVTTRSIHTMRYLGYSDEFHVKILSGVDAPVFDL